MIVAKDHLVHGNGLGFKVGLRLGMLSRAEQVQRIVIAQLCCRVVTIVVSFLCVEKLTFDWQRNFPFLVFLVMETKQAENTCSTGENNYIRLAIWLWPSRILVGGKLAWSPVIRQWFFSSKYGKLCPVPKLRIEHTISFYRWILTTRTLVTEPTLVLKY